MSCEDCSQQQRGPSSAFYRWRNANIEMRGCDVHLREAFHALNRVEQLEAALREAYGCMSGCSDDIRCGGCGPCERLAAALGEEGA